MSGTVIEILSTRKLLVLFIFLLLFLVGTFLIGGLIAPQPSAADEHITRFCVNETKGVSIPASCPFINDLHDEESSHHNPTDVVFSTVIPRPGHMMHPWFQYLLALVTVRVEFKLANQYVPDAKMLLDVKIFYSDVEDTAVRNNHQAWRELAHCNEERTLECIFDKTKTAEHEGFEYDCDAMHLFQLGSVSHKYYLVNIRLPTDTDLFPSAGMNVHNTDIGHLKEMSIIAIRQTGGFTKVWLSLKSVMSFVIFFPLVWFWRRITLLERKPMLIEKAIFALGLSMLFLNLPLELISIYFHAPWMLFFVDVRQGLFYGVLLSFWIIFIGEHLMDQPHRNKISAYRCHLGVIFSSMLALLAFDVAERGMQLVNPCTTVWTHPHFALSLLIVASVSGCIYFLLLCYMVFKVFRAISYKKRFVLPPNREHRFRTIVYRFRTLMLLTVITAALTVVFYIFSQKYEGLLHYGEQKIQVSSAFFTGVYGLWNIYVFLVLSVYAPSHKKFDSEDDANSHHELIALNTTDQTQIFQLTQQKEQED